MKRSLPTATPYPSDGTRDIKRPIIPEQLLEHADAEPHAEILSVPEGCDGLDDIDLIVEPGLSVGASTVGTGDGSAGIDGSTETLVDPEDLDVSANAQRFFEVLVEEVDDAPVTSGTAADIAAASGVDAIDVSRRTIRNWLSDLVDEGALRKEPGEQANEPDEYHLRG